ncbi:immunoglobulin superfamily member 10 [Amia ocellicauda]|uniref:immunoglobulin superfamily member 10 n=1 Tax=Amia ocellicauda TaxID=2972642 RepID=UPI003463D8C8
MKVFSPGTVYLRWRTLAFLCFFAKILQKSSGCPKSCACYIPTEVHCTFRYLTAIPGEIQPDVERINLGYNSLTTLKENDFTGLKHLELLMLHSNAIQTIENKALGDLKSLQVLKMSYNKVKEINKETFRGLQSLVRLHMDHNKIEFINPEAFFGLTALKLVHLEGNLLQQLHPDTFVTMRYSQIFKISSVKNIFLSDNSFRSLPPELFSYCTGLESVYMHGNPWQCDCSMQWFVQWAEENPGVLKCKRDRRGQQCPSCESPAASRGKDIARLPPATLSCYQPWIHPHLKQKNISIDQGEFTPVSSKDFIAPIGSMVLNMTDQSQNDASVICTVQRPNAMTGVSLEEKDDMLILRASLATFLVCNIDYEHIQPLWKILATYSDMPMRLERGLLLTKTPSMIYKYHQKQASEEEDVFTAIEAEVKADPMWLMQGEFTLQLDRATTTFTTLHIKYFTDFQMILENKIPKSQRYSWALIRKDNTTKTEHSVLIGGTAELECQVSGEPKPLIEWILPDGSKVRAPYISEDRRIIILDTGKLTLRAADSFDTGLYRCIATNYLDADLLTYRITVVNPEVEETDVNGVKIAQSLGSSLYLHCGSEGNPDATINWILPDHSVLDKSFGQRKLFPNGTLAIDGLTERDRGFYICLAANHMGVDFLLSRVMLSGAARNNVALKETKRILSEGEGSGNEPDSPSEETEENYNALSPGVSNRTRQESRTITSDRPYPRRRITQGRTSGDLTQRRNGFSSNTRRVGGRTTFDKALRKVDPQQWTKIMKKAQKHKASEGQGEITTNGILSKTSSGLSGDGEEASGDALTEDDFLVIAMSPASSTIQNPNQETTTLYVQTYALPIASPATPVTIGHHGNANILTTKPTPLTPTLHSTVTSSPGLNVTDELDKKTDQPLPQPVTLKLRITESTSEMQPKFSSNTTDTAASVVPLLMTSMIDKPGPVPEPVVHTATYPNGKASFTAVTTSEGENDEILFHTTQKITSPRLPSGSTIISHQQIQIIRGDTAHSDKVRSGKKRKFPSRRRIIRPNKITDISAYLNKFSKSIKKPAAHDKDNTTMPATIELTTKCECQITDMPLGSSLANPAATESDATNSHRKTKGSISVVTPTSGPNIQSSTQLKTTKPWPVTSEKVLDTSTSSPLTRIVTSQTQFVKVITQSPTTEPMATSKSTTGAPGSFKKSAYPQAEHTEAPKSAKSTSKPDRFYTTTTKASISASKVIRGKIPWHRLFGNKPSQKELLNRLRRPVKPITITKRPPARMTSTTAPAQISSVLPTTRALASPITNLPTLTENKAVIQSSVTSSDYSSGSASTTEAQPASKVIISPVTAKPRVKDKTAGVKTPTAMPKNVGFFTTTEISPIIKSLASSATTTMAVTDKAMSTVQLPSSSGFASGSLSTTEEPLIILPQITSAKSTYNENKSEVSMATTTAARKASASGSNTKTRTGTFRKHMGLPRRKGFRRMRPGKKTTTTTQTTTAQIKEMEAPVTLKATTPATKAVQPVITSVLSKPYQPVFPVIMPSAEEEHKAYSTLTAKPTTAASSIRHSRIETSIKSEGRGSAATSPSPKAGLLTPVQTKTATEKAVVAPVKTTTTVKPTTPFITKSISTTTRPVTRTNLRVPPSTKPIRLTTQRATFSNVTPTAFSATVRDSKSQDGSGRFLFRPKSHKPTRATFTKPEKRTQFTVSSSRFWEKPKSEATAKGKTLILDTLTILTAEQAYTNSPAPFSWDKDNTIANRYDKLPEFEASTSNVIAMEPSPKDQPSKPRIVGGNAASFTVLSNSDAFLPCEAIGNPAPTLSWIKVSSGTTLTMKAKRGNRFEMFKNGTLSIQNANIQDRGQYLCLAENRHGSDKLLVTLSVVAYPSRILEPKVRDIKSHSGNTVEIKCKAEGRPIPLVSWILANKTVVRGYSSRESRVAVAADGTLTIKEVSVYDRGHYKCVASNPAGVDTATVQLQVVAAPPGIVEDKRQQVRGEIGQHLKMPCTGKGSPQPTIHWVLFDGTVVKPLHYINPKVFAFPNGTLYIKDLAVSDSGKYECIATSSTGSERRVVNLLVEQKETVPRIVTASDRRTDLNYGDQLQLNCSAFGDPKPRIMWRLPSKAVVDQWHRMGNRIHVLLNGSLIIDAVSEKDAGDYLCVARNKIGDDFLLMKVTVSMKPAKIEYKPFIKKQVTYGNDLKVDCKASGAPEPEISWGLPDGTLLNSVLQADDNGGRSRRYVLFDNGTLYLNKVGMSEEGDYTCYAENTLGKDEMKVHITVVTAAPRIKTPQNTYTKVSSGDKVMFDCEAMGEPKPKILWLLPSNDMIAASNDRHLMHVNGSLAIRNVKITDAGEYVCVARNSAGDDTKVFKLEVNGNPPTINGLYMNKTIVKDTAIKHTRKLIDCKAEGTPTPQVMWIMPDNIFITAPYYGSRIIVHKNGTLEIRNVRPTDTAEFICVARNDGGETVMIVQLEVTDMLRRPMFKNPFNEKVITRTGKTTILNCSADGHPLPEIIWLLPNGTRFTNSQRILRYQLGNDGTFIIYNPSKDDAGKYRCAARNTVGYIEKLIVLEVGQKPYILTRPRGIIRSISGEPLFLHCLADGSPRPKITWTVPGGHMLLRPQINGKFMLLDNGTLVIREASLHDRGNYICAAKNDAGEATVTIPVIIIAYPPRITNGPPQSVRARKGVPVHLNCMAIGIPKPEITWELPDHSVLSTAGKGRPTGSELLHPQGTLVIQKPTHSDTGTYKCIARNHLGTDSKITYIQVL